MDPEHYHVSEESLRLACQEFWHNYYDAVKLKHLSLGREISEPIKGRNLITTKSQHVAVFENFWRRQLAAALGVKESEVKGRQLRFKGYRTKSFDVCFPLAGEAKILISIKSMQNAYRNFTNRLEEAIGDSAVLRFYGSNAVFGFFVFMVDGNVPRGLAVQGQKSEEGGVAPFLDVMEEGGDFFDLSRIDKYRKSVIGRSRGRQDVIKLAEKSLTDLVAENIELEGGTPYDAVAFVPVRMRKTVDQPCQEDWSAELSEVNPLVHFERLIPRLIETAKVRGFL